jgi:hypothetical protein
MRVTAEDVDTRRLTFLQKVGISGYYERTDEPNMGKPMTPNTPLADALMLKIRDQYPHESEERHRKRFMELVRNGAPELREEIAKSLFAIYSTRPRESGRQHHVAG